MPNVMTAPVSMQKKQDHQDRPGGPRQQPVKCFLAMICSAMRAVMSREDAWRRTEPETAMDSLTRQYPYLYIRTVCG
jgi:hypothetical protein